MLTAEEQAKAALNLQEALRHFNGSETCYRGGIPPIRFTEGVRYLAETAGAFWLIDLIASWQLDPKVRGCEFQVWSLVVTDGRAVATCHDDDKLIIASQRIEFTDFPLPEIKLWLVDRTLMLPSEY